MSLGFLLGAFVTLFVIVDAFGNIALFESLLHGAVHRDKLRLITISTAIALVTLLVFTFAGPAIFQFFGVKLYSFKIAGGILLMIIALQMLFGIRQRLSQSEEGNVAKKEDVAVVPMAIPLQTGPGAITAGIVLASQATTFTLQGYLVLAILLVFLVNYLIYLKSDLIIRVIGELGAKIITRIMGLILAAMAIQFIANGAMEIAALI
ncbi:MAG: hypothetical protein A2729_02550 [Candidatus Buchananbacteria bacterium RIFCSPHIGHO2_01_FULL_39_14]|uniref:UPF0056 membrane protein n=1 Tax=Candidatus Buchananbacteria bacterium RIFCSPHIGHO2_01_FULL_39_14 TaxID=1797532 RepID=A0A1G1XUW9_9BACT|nr:MAG: hypothetical protein A2729_02550 [Candidatus Buchananbacteria bacterium RIFCSPHIGHO2_01_FULL_39_14]